MNRSTKKKKWHKRSNKLITLKRPIIFFLSTRLLYNYGILPSSAIF